MSRVDFRRVISFFPIVIVLVVMSLPTLASHKRELLRLKPGVLTLGAELEAEILFPDGDNDLAMNVLQPVSAVIHTNRNTSKFRIDKLTLIPELNLNNDIRFYAEIDAVTSRAEVDTVFLREAHITFYSANHYFLKVGMDDRFISPEFTADNGAVGANKRFTDVYPIGGAIFWEDEDLGVTIGGDHDLGRSWTLDWRASLSNGLYMDHDELTRNQIYPILTDDRHSQPINIDLTNNKEWGLGGGWSKRWTERTRASVFGFYFISKLGTRDIDFLNEVIPGYTSRTDTNRFAGFNIDWTWKKFNLFTQHIWAKDGQVRRTVYYLQPSYNFSIGDGKYFTDMRLLYRYNRLDLDIDGLGGVLPQSTFTWNRETHTIALNFQVAKALLWRNEVHINDEQTGSGASNAVSNNEYISQLELRF